MGNEYLIEQVPDVTEFGVWYQYFVVFYKNQIKVARTVGKIRKLEVLFDLTDDSVQRGTVALGTNGDALNTYFDQFECVPFEPQIGIINKKVEQHREYGECMFPKNVAQRQSFFEKRYHTHEKAKLKNILINYCWDCCSEYVESWEKLLHYDCVKLCTQITRSHEKTLRE